MDAACVRVTLCNFVQYLGWFWCEPDLSSGFTGLVKPNKWAIFEGRRPCQTRPRSAEFWNGQPEELRVLFALAKPNVTRARCTLWSHFLGYEIKLDVNVGRSPLYGFSPIYTSLWSHLPKSSAGVWLTRFKKCRTGRVHTAPRKAHSCFKRLVESRSSTTTAVPSATRSGP